ncbi:protein translocase subunit SecF [Crocosphaera watsonii WH 8501]|uniref:Protein-export membrane protein SecF n=4 Tax=Crocosphaera watsonii TaxID=263511 RepID=Q4C2U0_CROWT|nr:MULTISPECIES: protein translocase subunit SecF [Crocosphaera]EAM50480.1 SecD/SecF/SecDF export membrane protein:SecF protein [Crocosphaera watsonii WH 8501]EHJ09357.1 Protein-export membrane protein SecF (TC 3.A.5.1.1) [Crocosphaera watsonii WH 0003]MCH2246486.1 protein translocase subunit SecF [Crocosphaera sp.]NQZ65458.1 protein translocase subunit SecF [Crocosphaera sp.]CCQ61623.1 Protein-export membrane protein SecF (TC 3.A.5.1.1) [Crocosphaera watsonii WH 0401]
MRLQIIKLERLWWSISALIILGGIIAMIISYTTFKAPLRPGLDFIGGTRLQLQLACGVEDTCEQAIDVGEVRNILTEKELGNSTIQVLEGTILSIRTKNLDVDERTQLQQELNEKIGDFDPETTQIDTVGPTIGKELFESGILALLVSFFGIIVYLSVRFKFDYALFAILALVHDVLITAGFFAVLGLVAGVEVDSLFLVALLTIIGFSVNDTVVIYDRIRENTDKYIEELSINDIVENSVNQSLTRSINTTVTTLLPLIGIFLFGGETLKYFSLALILGFIAGSYSSIFIASTLLAWWRNRQALANS